MRELLLPRILFALPQHGRLRNVIATVAVATVVVAGASLIPNGGTPVTPPGPGTANIWIDSNGGTCQRSGTAGSYVDATACGTFDAANDICQSGDLVYVKTATAYPGGTITGSNGRSTACTIEAEPSTSDIQLSSDITFGTDGGDGPDWLTVKHVQCGSDNTSYTNETELTLWGHSDNITLDDWDCPSFDVWGASNLTIQNSDIGPCTANATRKCVPRVGTGQDQPSLTTVVATNVVIQDTNFHDIGCGNNCGPFHTDGLALFGSESLTLRRDKFWKNDLTNIRIQNNTATGQPNNNLTIENNWFGASCAATPTNCTGGFNANSFDVDNRIPGLIVRFNSLAASTYIQCNTLVSTNPDVYGCGTAASPAVFRGNIYSTHATICRYTGVTMTYNAESHWGGSSDSVCGGTGNNMGNPPSYVQGSSSAVINFHLSGTNNADNLVTTGCIATDIDSQTRAATSCDAGSDER